MVSGATTYDHNVYVRVLVCVQTVMQPYTATCHCFIFLVNGAPFCFSALSHGDIVTVVLAVRGWCAHNRPTT
jgi:hypothetical protein